MRPGPPGGERNDLSVNISSHYPNIPTSCCCPKDADSHSDNGKPRKNIEESFTQTKNKLENDNWKTLGDVTKKSE